MDDGSDANGAARQVEATRINTSGHAPAATRDAGEVVVEAPLTIDVQGVGSYTIMSAPVDTTALAVGFLFGEGLINGPDDILLLERCPDDPTVIRVQLAGAAKVGGAGRNLLIISSCGLCGSQSIAEILENLPAVGEEFLVPPASLRRAVEAMRERQGLFERTGCTHAAAIFARDGALVAVGEDIGRHSALDKAIGVCLLERRSPAGHGVALSGRVSLEMVGKSARAGIELIAAVSAPTTLAIDAAERCNITLCAFVRDTRATVYCHPKRILNLR